MSAKEKEKFKFEKSFEKIEGAVEKLESGELGLEESLKVYEEGVGEIKKCLKYLEEAELRVKALTENGEKDIEDFTTFSGKEE